MIQSLCSLSQTKEPSSLLTCVCFLTFWQRSSVAYVFINLVSVMSSTWGFYIKWVWGLGNVLGAYAILSMHEAGYCRVARMVWKRKKKKKSGPQMTINECEGKSRNRGGIDYAARKFSLNLYLFSAQGFSWAEKKKKTNTQTSFGCILGCCSFSSQSILITIL